MLLTRFFFCHAIVTFVIKPLCATCTGLNVIVWIEFGANEWTVNLDPAQVANRAEAFEIDNSGVIHWMLLFPFYSLKEAKLELNQNALQTVYSIHTAIKLNSPAKPIVCHEALQPNMWERRGEVWWRNEEGD